MKNVILIATLGFMLVSCVQSKKEDTLKKIKIDNAVANNSQIKDGYILMKKHCYVCHNPNTKSHDVIIAPPLEAIKRRYNRQYSNNEDFTKALANFVQNPSIEKSLMPGAVTNFNLMPEIALDTIVLRKIGNYMYKNKLEQPEWFEDHFKEMHGEGKGMRQKN